MKRIISAIAAFTLAGMMSMTAFAQAAPAVNAVTEEDILPAEAGTDVKFGVDPVYTVTIPAKVTLDTTDVDETIKVEGETEGSIPMLKTGQKVVVTLSDAENGFDGTKLTVKASDTAKATYTVKGKGGEAVGKDGVVAEFDFDPDQTADYYKQKVTFTKPKGVEYAGTYTDQLTFTVAVEGDGVEINLLAHDPQTGYMALTDETITVPAAVGQKWQDAATFVPDDEFWAAVMEAYEHKTDKYPADTLYWNINEANGVSYYTGDKLYILYYTTTTLEEANPVIPTDEISDDVQYVAYSVFDYMS